MNATEFSHDQPEQVEKILCKAGEMFLTIGIRAVTLDDIARELGMSKKTIYTFFENKGQLVYRIVQEDLKHKQAIVLGITTEGHDPINEMLVIAREVMLSLQTFSVNIVTDLQKFYPESWQLIEQHKQGFVYNIMLSNHQRGKKEGLYRENLQEEIVTRMFIGFTDSILNPQGLLKTGIPIAQLYLEHLIYHLYSVCTDKGRQHLEELLQSLQLTIRP
jgi:AcrR family transcriptional regulator